ncbi:MAG: cytochrome d ubiquinol oxidase subunit II [bacterium]
MITLQVIWLLLIGILIIGYAILDGFDLGVGCWHLFAKKGDERSSFIRSIEPFWDGNEVWLLTGGGALFAAFPPVYATVFSGFYLPLMLVLLGLIFRAVSIEYRNKVENPRWVAAWDVAFSLGSMLPTLLYAVAVGNLLRGLQLDAKGDYTGGFFALLNPYSLVVGLVGFSMFALHGALYLAVKTGGDTQRKARLWAAQAWRVYALLFFVVAGWTASCYLRNGVVLPFVLATLAVVALALIRAFNRKGEDLKAFLASCASIALVMLSVVAVLFPNLVIATNDQALSLTIFNASSSLRTLSVMLVIALLGMPVVIGYTIFIHRIFKGKV